MLISLINVKRMAAALSLGLAIVLIQIPSVSAAIVQFSYSGQDSDTSAFGSFTLDDAIFDPFGDVSPPSSIAITLDKLLTFSFNLTDSRDLQDIKNVEWLKSGLTDVGATISFDFDFGGFGLVDVFDGQGTIATGPGGLFLFGRGDVNTNQFGSISSQDGDWQIAVIPLPAALPLYGAGLAVMGLLGWRRKRKAAAQA